MRKDIRRTPEGNLVCWKCQGSLDKGKTVDYDTCGDRMLVFVRRCPKCHSDNRYYTDLKFSGTRLTGEEALEAHKDAFIPFLMLNS